LDLVRGFFVSGPRNSRSLIAEKVDEAVVPVPVPVAVAVAVPVRFRRGARASAAAGSSSGRPAGAHQRRHTRMGPGLLESVYETCMKRELTRRSLAHRAQVWVPIIYEGERLEPGLRIDLLVEETVVVEIKAVAELHALAKPQVLSYLRLTGHPVGLILNFHVEHMRSGIRRLIHMPRT
jgi:GxxExxY protein